MKWHLLILFLGFPSLFAQQGDKQGQLQDDPIPASQIPPSPPLPLDQALDSFNIAKGFVIEPIAIGELVRMPVALSFDADGRAWVVEMTQYMNDLDGSEENKPSGKIRVLEDTDQDGCFDQATTFLDHLVLPRTAAVTSDGLLYNNGDALYFIQRDQLKPVGSPILVDPSYAAGGNPEHKANGLLLARDNWYYNAKSNRRYRRINGQWQISKTNFRGQWGICQDDAGRLFYNNNSTLLIGDQMRPNLLRHHPTFPQNKKCSNQVGPNRVYPSRISPGVNRAYLKNTLNKEGKLIRATSAAGMTIYRGDNFPPAYHGSAFTTEPSVHLLKLIKISRDLQNKPSGTHPIPKDEFLTSTDEWFRPVNIYTAPDGTLWLVDMYFGLLQHRAYMTTYLRKQYASRQLDKPMENNGRIYRIRYQSKPASSPLKLSQKSNSELTQLLSHPNGWVRDTCQRLLVERLGHPSQPKRQTLIQSWQQDLETAISHDPSPWLKLHALWIYESLPEIPGSFLKQCLQSAQPELVSSALELAHHSRPSPTALILKLPLQEPILHSYLFALGKLATPESHQHAMKLIRENHKVRLLQEAYISGLGSQSALLANSIPVEDKKWEQLLKAASDSQHKAPVKTEQSSKESIKHRRGKQLYLGAAACASCHGQDAAGIANLAPPLVPSDWISGDQTKLLKIVLHGLQGPIKVNGKNYTLASVMPGISQRNDLKDQDIAHLLNYLIHQNNQLSSKKHTPSIRAEDVKRVRKATFSRKSVPYTASEL